MLLDQQVPLERAFGTEPCDLARRLGHKPTAPELAEFDPEALAAVFAGRSRRCTGTRSPWLPASRRCAS